MKKSTILILVIIGLIAVPFIGLGLKVVFFPVHSVSKGVDTAYEITNRTMNGENAIYNYEWFKRQAESIESLYKKEERAQADVLRFKSELPSEREKWSREDKTEYDRLQAISTGLSNQLNDAIAEYNARSSMANRAIFKEELPSNISRAILQARTLTK